MENKEEVVKELEYIFASINAKVNSFEPPFVIYSGIHPAGTRIDIFKEENKSIVYPIILSTKLGELKLNLNSKDLNNLKYAIGVAYSYSGFHIKDQNIDSGVQKRMWAF